MPTAGFERCNRTSSYSSDEVIGLIPPDRRPAPLQQDHSRIFISFEKFKKAAALKPYCGTAETPVMTLHCEACRTPGLIDERSFAGPYRGTFRNSRNDVGAA